MCGRICVVVSVWSYLHPCVVLLCLPPCGVVVVVVVVIVVIMSLDPAMVDLRRDEWFDINVITGSLKLYFRELQIPVFPFQLYDKLIAAAST